MVKPSCPWVLLLGIVLSAVIRSFSVISLSHISKLFKLRFGEAILFKNDFFSESDLETFFLKKVFVKFTYASVDLFQVSNVFVIIN